MKLRHLLTSFTSSLHGLDIPTGTYVIKTNFSSFTGAVLDVLSDVTNKSPETWIKPKPAVLHCLNHEATAATINRQKPGRQTSSLCEELVTNVTPA